LFHFTTVTGACVALVVACLSVLAQAQAVDLTGRLVPLRVAAPAFARGVMPGASAGGDAIEWPFELAADFDLQRTSLALLVGVDDRDALPDAMELNGDPLEGWPVLRDDGLVVRLPAHQLRHGANTLRLTWESSPLRAAEPATAVREATVFSLLDGFEEVHFERAFAGRAVEPRAQPATHPDQAKIDVLHYGLDITLTMSSATIPSATLTARVKSLAAGVAQVVLDFDTNGGAMTVSRVDSGPSTATLAYTLVSNRILVTLPAPLALGAEATVRIAYSGTPSTGGAFGAPYRRSTHGNPAVPIIFTFSEPYGARKWWPCKDLPDDKATFDVNVTAPKPYTAVSNGTLLGVDDLGANQRFRYSHGYPLSTYLVSITCTNYALTQADYTALDGETTMIVGHYLYPESTTEIPGIAGTLDAMGFFARTFGEYPFLSEKYVTSTHTSGSGMEHQTCTSMPVGNLAPDGKHRRNIHELAHHWFGDEVTCETFDHLWLNEGFATYCEALYSEYDLGIGGYYSVVDGFVSTGISDTTPLVNSNADAFAGNLVYRKGGFVLHMLRRVMGDDAFFPALRDYLQRHSMGTVVTSDFQVVCEEHHGASLDYFFQEWVYGIGRPTYGVGWQMEGEPGARQMRATLYQTQGGTPFTMPVDLRVTSLSGEVRDFTVFNNASTQEFVLDTGDFDAWSVEIDPGRWILKNLASTTVTVPVLQRVQWSPGQGGIEVSWTYGGSTAALRGFQIAASTDLETWSLLADTSELGNTARSYLHTGVVPGQSLYVRIRALSTAGQVSALSDTYGARRPQAGEATVLVVESYDRWDTQNRGISHSFAATHGLAIAPYGAGFDTFANEAVTATSQFAGYAAVLYLVGEDSTAEETFSDAEQAIVAAYLDSGGRFFASGAEIGWDLGNRGTATDNAFLANYLNFAYVGDDSNNYSAVGIPGGPFDGLTFACDDGTAGIYRAEFPDIVGGAGGSTVVLNYGTGTGAGTAYTGLFGAGAVPGRVICFGFPFETITTAATRASTMERILGYLGVPAGNGAPVGLAGIAVY